MKEIARSTVKDRHALFQYTDDKGRSRERGFMITINPCSDLKADRMCRSVRDFAKLLICDFVLAIENYQWRGKVEIYRPHAHLLVDVGEAEANRIADHFRHLGANVKIDPMCDVAYLLKYVSKDTTGSFYLKQVTISQNGKGSPPSTLPEVEEAVEPVHDVYDVSTERRNTIIQEQVSFFIERSALRSEFVVKKRRPVIPITPWPPHLLPSGMIRAP